MKPIKVERLSLKGYSVSPYNFVSLPSKAVSRYNNPKELPAHNSLQNRDGKELLSGVIEYTMEAMTPIIVSGGMIDKDALFFKNLTGDYAIPGNTIRGMVRTNSQTLSFSNIVRGHRDGKYPESEIADSKFLFRDITGNGSLAERYRNILNIDRNKRISKNMKAGYMVKEGKKYFIKPAIFLKEGMPYLRVDEILLRKIYDKDLKGIEFMYEESLINSEKELGVLNKAVAERKDRTSQRKIQDILKRHSREKWYKPYQLEISFEYYSNDKAFKVTKVGRKGKYSNNGYILSGGFIRGKRSHYVVGDIEENSGMIEISHDDKEAYIDDLIMTKKMSKSDRKMAKDQGFFGLPSDNEIKPIFFIQNNNKLHFGFTPYLRMIYSKSILDGICPSYKDVKGISYTDSLFGFINLKDDKGINLNYKSRISFEDAVAHEGAMVDKDSTIRMLLAEPKPTSYNLYLKQKLNADKKQLKIYEDDFEIRGIKQYWLKDYIEMPDLEKSKAENMIFTIHPLKESTKFSGKIHFSNLEEDELGLLIWSLKLDDNCYQNIGLAKPYGFGRVKLDDISLKVENLEKKYDEFSFDYMEDMELDKYLDMYKKTFSNKYLSGKSINEQESIKELMYIKKTLIDKKDASWYRYMELDEFKDRKVLPSILEYNDNVSKDNPGTDKGGNKGSYQQKNSTHNSRDKRSYDNKPKNIKSEEAFGNSIVIPNWNAPKEQKRKNK